MERSTLKTVISDQIAEFSKPSASIARILPASLEEHLASQEISVITGVRRCGKSTLLKQIASNTSATVYFLNLESPFLDNFTLADFQTVYELWLELIPPHSNRIIIMYDEIQNISGWERWVRHLAEKSGHKVFITGSNSEMLSSELASSLTGRHRPIHLTPFGIEELLEHFLRYSKLSTLDRSSQKTRIEINKIVSKALEYGLFPRSFLDESASLLPLYFNDIITRDILQRRKVRQPAALLKLGELLAREHTRLFNRKKTGELLNLRDNTTLNKYCEYFKECFLFSELRTFSNSLRKQLRSHSKFYCVDPRLPSVVTYTKPAAAFENLVFLELRRKASKISYWHSKEGFEIDFIIEDRSSVIAVQACYSVSDEETLERETRGLYSAIRELGCKKLFIVTASEERTLTSPSTIHILPIHRVSEIFS